MIWLVWCGAWFGLGLVLLVMVYTPGFVCMFMCMLSFGVLLVVVFIVNLVVVCWSGLSVGCDLVC